MKFPAYKGFDIQILPTGAFVGTLEDQKFESDSLEGLKKKIDDSFKVPKRSFALPVVGIKGRSYSGSVTGVIHGTICKGINRTSSAFQYTDDVQLDYLLADTAANRQRLEHLLYCEKAVLAARKAVEDRRINPRMYSGRIEAHHYNEVVDRLIELHGKSSAE